MFYIKSFQAASHRKTTLNAGFTERSEKGSRGKIYDRNGIPLAENITKVTFWTNTNHSIDKESIALF